VLGIGDSICSGACVLVDGVLRSAVSEERLSRVKLATGWPRLAIAEALRCAGVAASEVDQVAVATHTLYWRAEATTVAGYFDADWGAEKKAVLALGSIGSRLFGGSALAQKGYYALKSIFSRRRHGEIERELREIGVTAPIGYVDHHLAHAASAYYAGGHEDANIATLDGAGDGLSATIYRGKGGVLERVARVPAYDSVGNFYSYVTHVLGFKAHRHEGKITGLAAYGEPRYADLFRSLVEHRDGRIANRARAFHTSAIEKVRRMLPKDPDRADVAASIQLVLEEVATGFVSHWVERLGSRHLGLAGGVVANVKLNQRLFALDGVPSTFVFPAMGDDGLAAGAAYFLRALSLPRERRAEAVTRLSDVYLGSGFEDAEIRRALEDSGLPYQKPTHLAAEVARLISEKRVVARFDGHMEYGPRALGNRSILVHAADPTVNDWLNKRLDRTEFMPFAPVSLADERDRFYRDLSGADHSAEFMTITCDCTEELNDLCPAVVHVDGTARPQLVPRDGNSGYRAILEEYRKIEGHSTIINTSFNMHEEPIVCTPQDAIRAFTLGHLDYLVLGDYLVTGSGAAAPSETRAGA
jgi:carbamoyltransferase